MDFALQLFALIRASSMLANLGHLKTDAWTQIPDTDYFVRREELRIDAKATKLPVPTGVLAKLVLCALALRFGSQVYVRSLDVLRDALRGDEGPRLHFGYLGDALDKNEVGCEHIVRVEFVGSALVADVVLFRKHRFTVTLDGVAATSGRAGLVLLEDIGSGQTAVNEDLEEFARTKRARVIRPL